MRECVPRRRRPSARLVSPGPRAPDAALERLGARTILFAGAPVLLLSGTTNLDLIAVAATTTATVAYLAGRRRGAGIALGIGAAAKLYPLLALLPFGVEDRRTGDRGGVR